MSELELAAMTKAASSGSILGAKHAIRSMTELSEIRREKLCDLIDKLYFSAFAEGALWMGKQAQEVFRA